MDDIDSTLDSIRKRWIDLADAPVYRNSLLLHLQSLASDQTWHEVESEKVIFPERLSIAFAICKCGIKEFIVDGSTQECQTCGSLMYRTEAMDYHLVNSTNT